MNPSTGNTLGNTTLERIHPAWRTLLLIAIGNLALIASSRVQIPFWPVPLTMETLVVAVIGASYGSRTGAATVGLFLAEGAIGLPVFAAGGGLAYFLGPTAGYLIGFLAATMLTACLVQRGWGKGVVSLSATLLLTSTLILGFGFAWLSHLIGMEQAFLKGVMPFIPGDIVKSVLAAVTVIVLRDVSKRFKHGINH